MSVPKAMGRRQLTLFLAATNVSGVVTVTMPGQAPVVKNAP
jgi:hypothetical protein